MFYVTRLYGSGSGGYKKKVCKRYNYKWLALFIGMTQWIFDFTIKEIIIFESADHCYLLYHNLRMA